VLPTELDNHKSVWIIDQINEHRVWPEGYPGYSKRLRYSLRIFVKSDFYDNFFTFFVFLNTITLSLDSYGISQERKNFLNVSNTYFTWIFIVEMVLKQVAIGMSKYLADKMNWLDGFIVMASIFELIFNALVGGEGVKGLSTLRMLRAIRVFRILRLLR
jgi:voltage-dependent calcium channel T type alpha-1G